ncbi:zinc finger CCHC domain-containing protein 9 isoform X2 [Monodelphis domestica]|uniref:Zinc finger CCHC-type containing 9 n=2 Tax=Monodelphis domestica TaxID=13616 RepID=F7CJH8_MONDO|nr:zinc finger CCHC domain-containing protein 9 isoform X2 [Monodelphis domestica]XP_007487436.1 zinc finger CCHC domain-containing protein 9 isoform X2 [Monodelphis domestica]XP_056680581.1 zinc finger CCHC domain-containing protein 9 isoform X2 [Monodelphis domestica]XP_056680582.1 zinc finger CCHC domain-containing protein 9 isoform X2 [Monodelphis domestica]XP_056680583.1 zinc finger CCHC domain-containing protein 9 isoform X2 [Monodelphis domestica]XP_056680584.1 zinc finger CCHC domain-c
MTRWARTNTAHNKKALKATSWEDMKKGSTEQATPNLQKHTQFHSSGLSLKNDVPRSKNKKKTSYTNQDVNGFMEYLRQNGEMTAVGSSEIREEIAIALKKDSRREGRRLKRQKIKKNAKVCYHCRKQGHGVADCPAVLESQDMGTGICYRCGSTEHEITKCKAKVDPAMGEFPFAKCFICGEMGHLSRSCPDNPKGLYAEGGGCRLCGSVEHFKKDCPENQNSDHMVTVGRWAEGMSADYEEILEAPKPQKPKTAIAKVVNF